MYTYCEYFDYTCMPCQHRYETSTPLLDDPLVLGLELPVDLFPGFRQSLPILMNLFNHTVVLLPFLLRSCNISNLNTISLHRGDNVVSLEFNLLRSI